MSSNIVGYINQPIFAGDNLIANQLANSSNSLDILFQGNAPEGATFTLWDAGHQQYLLPSTYDTASGWSIDYELNYGQGGLFHSPTTFTNTFVGTVWPGFDINNFNPPDFGQPVLTNAGVFLLSCLIPIAPANFHEVVGRDPRDGELVTMLNALTQLQTTTTFHNGAWDNGTPLLGIGQSAFFNLEAVPEPSVFMLLGVGAALLLAPRKPRKS